MHDLTPKPSWNPAFAAMGANQLQWIPRLGVGYLEVQGEHYDEAYFEHYRALADSPVGKALNRFRAELTRAHCADPTQLIDVGIGDGAFLRELGTGYGYDVNPAGVAWLQERAIFRDPYKTFDTELTFWDSLEHIRDPLPILSRARRAIVSIPIFRDVWYVLNSKHYKPSEHYWYFTPQGFRHFVEQAGFRIVFITRRETELGREDIETFVIERVR